MIPVSVAFEAFGPYVARQEVDFSACVPAGLMLIRGETGAGKTVILDAITYALYGRSSGGGRGEFAAMRGLSAPEDAPTLVEYVFELRGERFRFTRSLRPRKKRGGGYDYVQEQAAFRLDAVGRWEPFFENPRQRDVETKAQELIGLNWEQFCQVMILPQGKFERLLTAKSDEKEAVLVSLFHAERWQRIAEQLCQQGAAERQKLDAAQAAVRTAMEGWDCASADALRALLETRTAELAGTEALRDAAGKELETARLLAESAGTLAELFARRAAAVGELARIEAGEPEAAGWRRQLARGHAAQAAGADYERMQAADQELRRREAAQADGEAAAKQAEASLLRAGEQVERLAASAGEQESLRARLAELRLLREPYGRMDGAREQARRTQDVWERARDDDARARELADELALKRDGLAAERDRLTERGGTQLPAARERLARASEIRKLAQRYETAQKRAEEQRRELETLARRGAALAERARTADAVCADLRGQMARQLSASLARELEEGAPCPVCGSVRHPAPHPPEEASATESDLKFAERAASLARDAVTENAGEQAGASARLAAAEEERAGILTELGDAPPSPEAAQRALEQARREAQAEELARGRLPGLTRELRRIQEQLAARREAADALAVKLAEAAFARDAARALASELETRRDPSIPDGAALAREITVMEASVEHHARETEQARAELDHAARAQSAARSALEHLRAEQERAQSALAEAHSAFAARLAEQGFTDAEGFLSARLTAEALAELETRLRERETRLAVARSAAGALDAQLAGREPPDLDAARKRLGGASAEKERLDAAWGALSQTREQLGRTLAKVEKQQARIDARRVSCDKLLAFGKLLRGDSGVSLRRYVLGVMLSSVTAEANRLLAGVHGGRYQLYHTMEGTGRARKAGLELEVFDAQSGGRRGVASLSGGEKFLVSLALALGLSAVVQAQSGGIRMDAMFIDEGFGTLDPQSITDALGVLATVRGSRRLVGIISHVAALQENIQTSIEVVKERGGSRLILHV